MSGRVGALCLSLQNAGPWMGTGANEQLHRLAHWLAPGREKFHDEDDQAHEGAYGSDKDVKEWISMAHLHEEVPHTIQDRARRADLAGRNPAGQEQQHDNAETQRDKTYHEYYQSIEGISHLYHLIPDYIFTGGCSHTASFVLALRPHRSSSIAMLLLYASAFEVPDAILIIS